MDLRVEVGNRFISDNRHYKTAIMVISEMSKAVRILPGETDVAASSSLSPGDDSSQILYKKRLMLIPKLIKILLKQFFHFLFLNGLNLLRNLGALGTLGLWLREEVSAT
jgi:hypothetical protein